MGPIMPAGTGTNPISTAPSRAGGAGGMSPSQSLASSGGATSTSAISDPTRVSEVFAAVTQLLRGLGQGLENDAVLKMIIALLILMALLESSSEPAKSQNNNLLSLGGGASQPFSAITMTASSTTISIQQTSVYIVGGSAAQAFETLESTPEPGGQVDLSA
ncbi:MAG: hypothetical protein IIC01_01330 [Planctomycetes bacterium]|nr:hypothetical protein [Planctomycetota bacterium]